MIVGIIIFKAILAFTLVDAEERQFCSLNGHYVEEKGCVCEPGWKGEHCAELDIAPASPNAFGFYDLKVPTWGGGAIFSEGRWHLIVGSRAQDVPLPDGSGTDYTKTDYPCDSRIIRAVSADKDPAGPYKLAEVMVPRSSWEPSLTKSPNGELIMMFYGNITNPPPVGSIACRNLPIHRQQNGVTPYNLTTTNTYITVSHSGSPLGPWTEPALVKGMENDPTRGDPQRWSCASGNPSPTFHPNGTLFAAMRHNPCWKDDSWSGRTREHIGLWRADAGWNGSWEAKRGGYGWSLDGHEWTLETGPIMSNASSWDLDVRWTNGTTTPLARRQRVSFIRDPETGQPTHIINGADFNKHLSDHPELCEGCHWGQGLSLIVPLNIHN